MAGVKITDLPLITEAASGDLLYIVDVSNLTESPQGTSSQIAVGDLASIESGTWTPTITTDYSGSTLFKAIYKRVNNSVDFCIEFQLANSSAILGGDTFFTPPNGLVPSLNAMGLMGFRMDTNDLLADLTSFAVASNGTNIGFSMTNSASASSYRIIIQGTYLIA